MRIAVDHASGIREARSSDAQRAQHDVDVNRPPAHDRPRDRDGRERRRDHEQRTAYERTTPSTVLRGAVVVLDLDVAVDPLVTTATAT